MSFCGLFTGCKDPTLVIENAKHIVDTNDTETVITPVCVYPLDVTQAELDTTIYGVSGYKIFNNRSSTFQNWLLSGDGNQLLNLSYPAGMDITNPLASPRAMTFPAGNFAFEINVKNISKGPIVGADPQTLFSVAFTNQNISLPAFFGPRVNVLEDGSFVSSTGLDAAEVINGVISDTTRLGYFYDATAKTMSYYSDGSFYSSHALDLSAVGPFVIVIVAVQYTGSTGEIEFDLLLDKTQFTGTYPAGTTDICGN